MKRAQLTAAKHAARHSRIAHLLRTTCPYCHAPAGEPCRAKSGTPIWSIGQMHDARLARRQPPLLPIRPPRLAMTNLLEQAISSEREPPGR
jgi:hypothetical protein